MKGYPSLIVLLTLLEPYVLNMIRKIQVVSLNFEDGMEDKSHAVPARFAGLTAK